MCLLLWVGFYRGRRTTQWQEGSRGAESKTTEQQPQEDDINVATCESQLGVWFFKNYYELQRHLRRLIRPQIIMNGSIVAVVGDNNINN